MSRAPYRSEIRDSVIESLLKKVGQRSYQYYLLSVTLEKIRLFAGARITFDFPVVALIGPNGGGKTTVLAACQSIYASARRRDLFQQSVIGDETPIDWTIEYEIVDRAINRPGPISGVLKYNGDEWEDRKTDGGSWRLDKEKREVSFLGVKRTLPLADDATFHMRTRLTSKKKHRKTEHQKTPFDEKLAAVIRQEGERILGKSLAEYQFFTVTSTVKQWASRRSPEHSLTAPLFVGKNNIGTFSELNFGAGESSVLRIVAAIEAMPDSSLILIDEIENGLHPVAVRRLVEYLIDVAKRKSCQVIFTTHSDYALDPLPGRAIWACLYGRVQKGKLSVDALRAVLGSVDKRLAVFVEDAFAAHWIIAALREGARRSLDEVGVYDVGGDGNAVAAHRAHRNNPSITFGSLCYLDGDSQQKVDHPHGIFRLPGEMPERTIIEDVMANPAKSIPLLTAACHTSASRQADVQDAIESARRTNRDRHTLFRLVGEELGDVPESVIRGAFLSVWAQEYPEQVQAILKPILAALGQ
jgi:predicted ATPase